MKADENYWVMVARYWLSRRWRKNRRKGAESVLRFRGIVRALPPNSLTIDCGANVGAVTGLIAGAGHRVIAFEPDPHAFATLQKKFADNPSVTLVNKAVGTENTTMQLYRTPQANAGSLLHTMGTTLYPHDMVESEPTQSIEVIDFPAFTKSLGEPIALVKMDIEGAEADILPKFLNGQHDHVGYFFVETHEKMIPSTAEAIRTIRTSISERSLQKFDLDWI